MYVVYFMFWKVKFTFYISFEKTHNQVFRKIQEAGGAEKLPLREANTLQLLVVISSFTGVSTFVGYLMLKLSFRKNSNNTI